MLFLSCLKVTELIEKSKIIPLSQIEIIRLKIHLSMCNACDTYRQQSDALDNMLGNLLSFGEQERIEQLSNILANKFKKMK